MKPQLPFVRESGRGQTVLCLHASTSSSSQWLALTERLASGYRVLAPDLVEHGKSNWRGWGEDAVDEDVRLLEAIAGDAPAHVVGHSYGGAVALRYAMRHPERVRSLVLYEPAVWRLVVDHSARNSTARDVFDAARLIERLVGVGSLTDAARYFLDYWNGPGTWDGMSRFHQDRIAAQMPRVVAHFTALFADTASVAAYAGLVMPALLMSGGNGPRCGQRAAELLAGALPRGVLRRFPQAGHMGPMTAAGEVNEAIALFITMKAMERGDPAARRVGGNTTGMTPFSLASAFPAA